MKTINQRAETILTAIVEGYIRDGHPIASKTLQQNTGLELSSATIRHIMAELEQAGYICSPHTSAGRIPTEQGYRFFVDTLLQSQYAHTLTASELQQQLKNERQSTVIESASSLLSEITQLAGIVSLPRHEQLLLRHLEFLPLSNARVLVILVLNEREVQNRIIHTDREYTKEELTEAANFIMAHFAGKELTDVRATIAQAMEADRQNLDTWMQEAMTLTNEAISSEQKNDYVLAGESNLLNVAALGGIEQLQSLFSAFQQKQAILHLLDCSLSAQGLQIFIGQESGIDLFGGCSLVTAPYQQDGQVVGVLGVIGPTRMNYKQAISSVEITAQALGLVLADE